MILPKILLVSLVVAAASAAPTDTHNLDYILANLTSLWEEFSQLKKEVNYHMHDGDVDHDHDFDKTMDEVSILAHEHHVHHLNHPHEGHGDHHNEFLLQHLETAHDHGHSHDDRDDHSSHGHSGSHGITSHGGGRGYDSDEDDDSDEDHRSHGGGHGRTDGLVDNCGDRGRRVGPSGIPSNCGDRSRDGSRSPGPSPPHRRGGYGGRGIDGRHSGHGRHRESSGHEAHGMHDDSHEDDHSYHGLDLTALGHVNSDAHFYEGDHYSPDPKFVKPGDRRHPSPGVFVDDWEYAHCILMPNSDIPESQVSGEIDISHRVSGEYGVFFDSDVHGLDRTRNGPVYSIHVHERAVEGQSCDTAGGYNRPSVAALADPATFGEEHAGNIGTFTAVEDGEIDHEISASLDVTFEEMIGKAIVVHSLNKERLACCNIVQSRRGMH